MPIGTWVTGTDAGTYLIAGPDWDGDVPEGIDQVLQFETNIVIGMTRTQLLSPDDLPTPESGGFYLILRIYMPKPSVLDGTWDPPAVLRID